MDLCIKTVSVLNESDANDTRFNPCFNGSMYKNILLPYPCPDYAGFNPCFNGSMYKNLSQAFPMKMKMVSVSILVLMDLCIKTALKASIATFTTCFNPCFNGSMYKNWSEADHPYTETHVSILVLMDLCIKTQFFTTAWTVSALFQSLF